MIDWKERLNKPFHEWEERDELASGGELFENYLNWFNTDGYLDNPKLKKAAENNRALIQLLGSDEQRARLILATFRQGAEYDTWDVARSGRAMMSDNLNPTTLAYIVGQVKADPELAKYIKKWDETDQLVRFHPDVIRAAEG